MVSALPGVVALITDPTQASTGETVRDARELAVFLEPAARQRLNDNSLASLLDYLNTLQASSRWAGSDPTLPTPRVIPYRAALVYHPDGRLAAAVGPARFQGGQGIPQEVWQGVVAAAAAGRCRGVVVSTDELAGCPVMDDAGRVQLVAAIARPSSDVRPPFADLSGQLARDLAGTLDILSQAFLPIFLALGLLAFLAARRLTSRLDQILSAAQAVSAGFLSRRVPDQGMDEISRVGRGFNVMAARLEEDLAAINAERARVVSLLRANRTLTASASHELRTPITVMRAHLESAELRGASLGPEEARVLNDELARLERLVEDLFALSRSQLGQLSVKVEPVDLIDLGEALATAVAPLAGARQVTVIRRLPRSLPKVLADRQRLYQAALNLMQNALRYTQPGGLIMLEAARLENRMEFTVADTGIGMSAEDLARVFEPFYRADKARARETGGSGLGLALVRELVEAMGGRVEAESEPGRGSRFTIDLPMAPEPPGLSLPYPSEDEADLSERPA
ncbi:MAG TPA: HAMP domain-containing sensor histidine kinase, partial [Deinococcales bacterium]|nr:HAMP domain-containing sensor histidine kinase [Deinococcales bacterium]